MQTNRNPYEQAYYPPKPLPSVVFMRKCVIWQIFRFIVINLKMLVVVSKSHSKR
ncbi:MAG: hypothetical protein PHR87_04570 [Sulfurospirillaceae bacterium]|nr:hypothetical protein [Sulfurospirillaceae bacterium]